MRQWFFLLVGVAFFCLLGLACGERVEPSTLNGLETVYIH